VKEGEVIEIDECEVKGSKKFSVLSVYKLGISGKYFDYVF
jgi:hypothetical protein